MFAADENILNSTRATDFITPKSEVSRTFRDAVLKLAKDHPFARRLVNSGRLSVPSTLVDSPLSTPDQDTFAGAMVPGAPSTDAPVRADGRPGWFLSNIGGEFSVVAFGGELDHRAVSSLAGLTHGAIPARPVVVVPNGHAGSLPHGITVIEDVEGMLAQRFDARPGTVYLMRPDQHVCARWRSFDANKIQAAIARATCNA